MKDIGLIEECYKLYSSNLNLWPTECVIEVDMNLLRNLGLADTCYRQTPNYTLNQTFHCLETEEKITLWNDKFLVWIVPDCLDGQISTTVMVALNRPTRPQLELALIVNGVFNNSQLILRVLEKLLAEMEENEKLLEKYS